MMNRKRSFYLWVGVLAMMLGTNLPAQDIAGDWQGRLKAGPGQLRVVVVIFKSFDGKWNGTLRSIDQSPDWGVGIPIDSIDLQGANLKSAVGALRGTYEGKVSPDGASSALSRSASSYSADRLGDDVLAVLDALKLNWPVLAIYAVPHATGQSFKDDAARAVADAKDEAITGAQANAFESGVRSARVFRLAHANHFVFFSNEADVPLQINAFLDALPKQSPVRHRRRILKANPRRLLALPIRGTTREPCA